MRRVAGLFGLILLLCGVIGRATPLATPTGLQCPTAAVQKIRVAVRDCCGQVTGTIERAPKAGERGFLQCRCNEKRAAQESSAPIAPALVASPLLLRLPVGPAESFEHRYVMRLTDGTARPDLRPPTLS